MIKMNKKMEAKIQKTKNCICSLSTINLSILERILFPEFKEVEGCFLARLTENHIPEKINLDMVMRVYGDRTGYEASRNELRINDYINYTEDEKYSVLAFALQLIESWSLKLKADFPHYEFNLILSCDDEYVTLRFHRYRNVELGWLEDNLESYDEAILLRYV